MSKIRRIVTLDHKSGDLFELVSDIGKYPAFIKWIQSMSVEHVSDDGAKTQKIGNARVGFSGFSEVFSTAVKADRDKKTVEVSLIKGPLKHLENSWVFRDRGDKTDVEFFLDFEFKNIILRALASANFELAFNRIMAAFVAEADRRYKNQSSGAS